ncbi:hypothetical protein GGR51DRAFT_559359 [Nemania sp. FL0031]|nr:hypothetical protein GGR51DRAFT_559359 [Nemania sp. FL0031]
MDENSSCTLVHRREELENKSQRLEEYMEISDAKDLAMECRDGLHVTGEIVMRLQTWISAADSQTLWIIGNPSTSEREASVAASHIVAIAEASNIPCISFFCRPALHTPSKAPRSGHQIQLTTLLYALIRQLSMLVPESFEDSHDITRALESLQGNPESIPVALEVIRTLFSHTSRLMLCVIDGLQVLDHRDNNPYIDQLLELLRAQYDKKVFKLLLTTSGLFAGGTELPVQERLDCMVLPMKMPGRALPGGKLLQSLYFG